MIKWISGCLKKNTGFSLTEILFVMIISTTVVATIVSLWTFTNQVWMQKSEQTMLRMELMKALEVIKHDIRLSSFTDMVFYPDTSTTFTAVSIPVADVDADGFFGFNAQGNIDWARTVIYHIYTDVSGKRSLRRTVYDPRDNTMTEAQRYAQLESVVVNGTGATGSITDPDFLTDLDTFEISPLSSVFDFYDQSVTPIKVGKVVFGWAKLDPGDHVIRFEVTGKNDSSAGYDIGLDSIMIEPCGSTREAEYYNSPHAHSGAISVSGGSVALVNDDVWGDDNYLEFRTFGAGNYVEFTDYYDLWRESSFEKASMNNTELIESENRAALSVPLEDDEGEYGWFAYIATGDILQDGADGSFNALESKPDIEEVTLRTLIRGSDTSMSEQEIDPECSLVRIRLQSGSTESVTIDRVYITMRDSAGGYNGLANNTPVAPYDPSDYHMHQQLFFRDQFGGVSDSVTIDANSEVFSLWSAYPFHTDNDYFITVHIQEADSLDVKYWADPDPTSVNAYYITKYEGIDCTADHNTDTFICLNHGLSNGQQIVFDGDSVPSELEKPFDLAILSGTPNWDSVPKYYVVNSNVNTFQVAKTVSGTPVDFTGNGSNLEFIECGSVDGAPYNTPNVYICANIDTWDASGLVESQIMDTTKSSPVYNEIAYSENRPAGSGIVLKARSSSNSDMVGAADWDTITGSAANPYNLSIGNGRYVQFQGEFTTEPYWKEDVSGVQLTYRQYVTWQKIFSGISPSDPGRFPSVSGNYFLSGLRTPWIDDVTIDWPGSSSICSLTGNVAKKNSYGQAMITIDGEALLKVLSLHLKLSKEINNKIIEAENYIEIEPRNTGK